MLTATEPQISTGRSSTIRHVVLSIETRRAVEFVDLTAAVWQRWPECPPYEGMHDEVIPHLTISDSAAIDTQFELPIAARAREVTLIEEDEPDGRWTARLHLPLLG